MLATITLATQKMVLIEVKMNTIIKTITMRANTTVMLNSSAVCTRNVPFVPHTCIQNTKEIRFKSYPTFYLKN